MAPFAQMLAKARRSQYRPPKGYSPIPRGKRGGFRKPDGRGGFDYWYPPEPTTQIGLFGKPEPVSATPAPVPEPVEAPAPTPQLHARAVAREDIDSDEFYTGWERIGDTWLIDRSYGGGHLRGDDTYWDEVAARATTPRPIAYFKQGDSPNNAAAPLEPVEIKPVEVAPAKPLTWTERIEAFIQGLASPEPVRVSAEIMGHMRIVSNMGFLRNLITTLKLRFATYPEPELKPRERREALKKPAKERQATLPGIRTYSLRQLLALAERRLAAAEAAAPAPADRPHWTPVVGKRDGGRYYTGHWPFTERDAADIFLVAAMSPEDPERSPRPKGGRADNAPHLTWKRAAKDPAKRAALKAQILEHLRTDTVPRTLNRIGVELFDQTGNILMNTVVMDVLGELVEEGKIAWGVFSSGGSGQYVFFQVNNFPPPETPGLHGLTPPEAYTQQDITPSGGPADDLWPGQLRPASGATLAPAPAPVAPPVVAPVAPAPPALRYKERQSEHGQIVLAAYDGSTMVGGVNAMETLRLAHATEQQTALQRAAGVAPGGKAWETMGTPHMVAQANVLASHRGKGYGKELYRQLFQKILENNGGRPTLVAPEVATIGSGTSQDALHVWESLAKEYPSAIRVLEQKGLNPVRVPVLLIGAPGIPPGEVKAPAPPVVAPVAPAPPAVEDYEGEPGNKGHLTRTVAGLLPVADLLGVRGARGEESAFVFDPATTTYSRGTGKHAARYDQVKWDALVASMRQGYDPTKPVFIIRDPGESPKVQEGNHRIRAAHEAGITHIPAEIKYFGHSEREGLVTTVEPPPVVAPAEPAPPVVAPAEPVAGRPSGWERKKLIRSATGKLQRQGWGLHSSGPGYSTWKLNADNTQVLEAQHRPHPPPSGIWVVTTPEGSIDREYGDYLAALDAMVDWSKDWIADGATAPAPPVVAPAEPFRRTNKSPPGHWTHAEIKRLALRRNPPGYAHGLKEQTFVYPGGKLEVAVHNDDDDVEVSVTVDASRVVGARLPVGAYVLKTARFDFNDPASAEKMNALVALVQTKESAQAAYDAMIESVTANAARQPAPAPVSRDSVKVEKLQPGEIVTVRFPEVSGAPRRKWMAEPAKYRVVSRNDQHSVEIEPVEWSSDAGQYVRQKRKPKATMNVRPGFSQTPTKGKPFDPALDQMIQVYGRDGRGHTTGHPFELEAVDPPERYELGDFELTVEPTGVLKVYPQQALRDRGIQGSDRYFMPTIKYESTQEAQRAAATLRGLSAADRFKVWEYLAAPMPPGVVPPENWRQSIESVMAFVDAWPVLKGPAGFLRKYGHPSSGVAWYVGHVERALRTAPGAPYTDLVDPEFLDAAVASVKRPAAPAPPVAPPPVAPPAMSGEALRIKERIEELERTQATMKAANRVVRSKKLTDEQKIAKLVADVGLSESAARKLLQPDFAGRQGYPGYRLTNNNANIKRLKGRFETVVAELENATADYAFDGGTVTDNLEDDRVQIFFDGKPDKDLRRELKGSGWRWAPSVGAWQRKRTENARYSAMRILDGLSFDTPVVEPEPVAAPPPPVAAPDTELDRLRAMWTQGDPPYLASVEAKELVPQLHAEAVRARGVGDHAREKAVLIAARAMLGNVRQDQIEEARRLLGLDEPPAPVAAPVVEPPAPADPIPQVIADHTAGPPAGLQGKDLEDWHMGMQGRMVEAISAIDAPAVHGAVLSPEMRRKSAKLLRWKNQHYKIANEMAEKRLEKENLLREGQDWDPLIAYLKAKGLTELSEPEIRLRSATDPKLRALLAWGDETPERLATAEVAEQKSREEQQAAHRQRLEVFGPQFNMMVKVTASLYDDADNSSRLHFTNRARKLANYVKVTYQPGPDLYDVQFGRRRTRKGVPEFVAGATYEGVYASKIRELFEEETGLRTSLGTLAPSQEHTHDPAHVDAEGTLQRPEATSPVSTPVELEGEQRQAEADTAMRDVELDDKITSKMAKKRTEGQRKKANDTAWDMVEKAALAGRALTDDELTTVAEWSGIGGIGADLNQYHTRPDIAAAVWELVSRHVDGDIKRVLEPACGAGVFLQTRPRGVAMVGADIDHKSAMVTSALHSTQDVRHQSLEEFSVELTGQPPGFDAVITNAPFCTRTGDVARLHKPHIRSADQYFVDTSLDHVRDGGVVAMIIHAGLLNNSKPAAKAFRERVLARAEIVDAYRLPTSAFKHTHAEVVSDVLVLRKRDARVAQTLLAAPDLEAVLGAFDGYDSDFVAGDYFESRPERILGTALMKPGQWGESATVEGDAELVAPSISKLGATPPGGPGSRTVAFDELEALAAKNDQVRELMAQALAGIEADKPPVLGETRMIGAIKYLYIGDPPKWKRLESVTDVSQIVQHSGDEAIMLAHDIAERIAHLQEVVTAGDFYKARTIRRRLQTRVLAWVQDHGIPAEHKTLSELSLSAPALLDFIASVGSNGGLSDLLSKDVAITVKAPAMAPANIESVASHIATQNDGYVTIPDLLANWTGASKLAGRTEHQVSQALLELGTYAYTSRGMFRHLEDYLTGDLYELLTAETTRLGEVAEAWEREALEHQIAQIRSRLDGNRKGIDDVTLQLRTSSWLPAHVWEGWLNSPEMKGHVGRWDDKRVHFRIRSGVYEMGFEETVQYVEDGKTITKKGIQWSFGGSDLLKYLNRLSLGPKTKEKIVDIQDHVQELFNDWIQGSEYRGEVEDRYNQLFRGSFRKQYSGAPLGLAPAEYDAAGNVTKVGLNPDITLHEYQRECVRWCMEQGSGIMALDVGLGKTFCAIMLARLLKQKGKARRPFIVVPKSVATNWAREVETLTPGARVLVIGEHERVLKAGQRIIDRAKREERELTDEERGRVKSYTRLEADNDEERNRKLAMVKQNEYDAIICTMPAFNRIPLREDTIQAYSDSDFASQRAQQLDSLKGKSPEARAKALAKLKAAWGADLAGKVHQTEMDVVYWEDMGIDCLMADEAHAFKNLHAVRVQGYGGDAKPKFLGGSLASTQAHKMQLRARFVRQQSPDNSVYFLTATPTKNSPLEVYNMLQHIAPEEFDRIGIRNVEEFVDRFCLIEERPYLHHRTGEIDTGACVVGFSNLGELEAILDKYMMVRTAGDVGLKIPTINRDLVAVDMTQEQQDIYETLRAEAENINTQEDPGGVFRIQAAMQKVAQDLALYKPDVYGDWSANSPKYQAAVERIVEGATERGGQIVFVEHKAIHQTLKKLLVKAGMDPDEIAIINADVAASSLQRQEIGDRFNRGEVKVVLGNVSMGEGVNLQGKKHERGTTDIHHLDQSYDPGTMHQREGRGVRQGNNAEQVKIHTYVARGSFDGFRYETMMGKEQWLQQLLRSIRSGVDNVENQQMGGVNDPIERMIMMSADPEAERIKYDEMRVDAMTEWYAKRAEDDIGQWAKLQGMYARLKRVREEDRGTLDLSIQRLERKLARSEALPAEIKAYIAEHGAAAPPAMAVTRFEGEGEDQRLHARIVQQGAVLETEPTYEGGPVYRHVVTKVDPKRKTVTLRQWGQRAESVLEGAAAIESLQKYTESASVVNDEIRDALAADFKSYILPLSGLAFMDDQLLEANRAAIEQRTLGWLAAHGDRKQVLVESAGKVQLVPASELLSRDQLAAVLEAQIAEANRLSSASTYQGTVYRDMAEKARVRLAALPETGGTHAGARILFPWGRDVELMTEAAVEYNGDDQVVRDYGNPAVRAMALLAGTVRSSPRLKAIQADASRRLRAAAKKAAA